MTPDLVIFDCDGVLVDSEPIINRARAELLAACGYQVTPEELAARFLGMSDPDMLAVIEREWGGSLPPSYADRVGAAIERVALPTIEGIAEVLDALPMPYCVASSSSLDQILRKLELTGLLPRFGENLFSATMVACGQPAPDLFQHAALQMGAAPARCLIVEDSPAGIEGAVAAGMAAIGFCGGGLCRPGHGARLLSLGAAAVIADMHTLTDAVARL